MSISAHTITGSSELGKPPSAYPVAISQPLMTPGMLLPIPAVTQQRPFGNDSLLPSAGALHTLLLLWGSNLALWVF